MNNRDRAFAARALTAAAMVLILAGCSAHKQAAVLAPKSVTVASAHRATIALTVDYAAQIRSTQEIVVSPKVAGRVATVRADIGQNVRAGQVLFTLESKDYDAQARQAQAALDSAKANLTRTGDSGLSSQVIQAQAAVQQAQIQLNDAKDLYDRTQKLFTAGTASRQQLDGAKAKYDSAGIGLDTARQNLSLLQDKGGPQSTGVASSQVDQAQATADLAQSQLDNTIITSPITGVVASRAVDPGELVSSAVPAFVVIDLDSLVAEAAVEETQVAKIHVGQRVSVRVEAAGNAALVGVVQTISPSADPHAQGYTVKVRLEAPGEAVRPGMFARLSLPVSTRDNVLVVPNTAIVTETGVPYVYLVVSNIVKKTAVQIGSADQSVTEVTEGLSEGALVITEGQSFLAEGDTVTPAQ